MSLLHELKSHFRQKLFSFLFPGQDWQAVHQWICHRNHAASNAPPPQPSAAELIRRQPDKYRIASDVLLMDTFRVDYFAPGHVTQPALMVGNKSMLYNTF